MKSFKLFRLYEAKLFDLLIRQEEIKDYPTLDSIDWLYKRQQDGRYSQANLEEEAEECRLSILNTIELLQVEGLGNKKSMDDIAFEIFG